MSKAKANASDHDDTEAVERWLDGFSDALKPVLLRVRTLVLASHKEVTEGIKWNAPSFFRNGWFATVNVRGNKGVLVVLHRGVAKREDEAFPGTIPDPDGLLEWPSTDRALVSFRSMDELERHEKAFTRILKAWAKAQV